MDILSIVGIDLAAHHVRNTGIAFFVGDKIYTRIVHTDKEILSLIIKRKFKVAGIDSPLSLHEGRMADSILKRFGAMPLKLPSIKALALRAIDLKNALEELGLEVIEVFPTATAKILGFYTRNRTGAVNYLRSKGFEFITANPTRDEIDAAIALYQVYLHITSKAVFVGDPKGGYVSVPNNIYNIIPSNPNIVSAKKFAKI